MVLSNHTLLLIIIVLLLVLLGMILASMYMKSQSVRFGGGEYLPSGGGCDCGSDSGDDSDSDDSDSDSGDAVGGDDDEYMTFGGKSMRVRIRLRDPGYTSALNGKKKSEGVLNVPPFSELKAGSTITVMRSRPKDDTKEYEGIRRFKATVDYVKQYKTYGELLKGEGVDKVMPGKTEKEATEMIREFIKKEDEATHGLIAIGFTKRDGGPDKKLKSRNTLY